ncbi:carbohydrate ABC transporter permease, partial [Bacillus amyloliquefaciens]
MSVACKDWRVLALLAPATLVIMAPFLWLITSSLKTEAEIGAGNPFALPNRLMWQNYVDAWNVGGFADLIGNSLMNVAGVV